MINETGVYFFPGGGHDHDGESASLIDTNFYSIFDFPWTTEIGGPDRKRRLENNYNSFKNFIITTVNDSIIRPAGIFFQPGSINASSDIITNSITTNLIQAGAITADLIQAGTITATQIAANTITADLITANTITAAQIAANTITATQIATNTITANNIAANTITAAEIAADTITAAEIAAGAITAAEIAAGAITAAKIAAGTITANEISAAYVYTGSLSADQIIAGTISADKISGGVIDASDINGVNITGVSITGSTLSGGSINIAGAFQVDASGSMQGRNVTIDEGFRYRCAGLFNSTGSATTARVNNPGGVEALCSPSSKREYKYNIEDIPDALGILRTVRPRIFNWKIDVFDTVDPWTNEPWTDQARALNEFNKSYGFIAEEMAEDQPLLTVYESPDRSLPMDQDGGVFDLSAWQPKMWKEMDFIPLLVKAVQELSEKVATLERELGYTS